MGGEEGEVKSAGGQNRGEDCDDTAACGSEDTPGGLVRMVSGVNSGQCGTRGNSSPEQS